MKSETQLDVSSFSMHLCKCCSPYKQVTNNRASDTSKHTFGHNTGHTATTEVINVRTQQPIFIFLYSLIASRYYLSGCCLINKETSCNMQCSTGADLAFSKGGGGLTHRPRAA